jgi:hypothetical protein
MGVQLSDGGTLPEMCGGTRRKQRPLAEGTNQLWDSVLYSFLPNI